MFRTMGPEELAEEFPWSPLKEVDFEIRFPSALRIMDQIAGFQDSIRLEFPRAQEMRDESGNHAWSFVNPESGQQVRVAADSFAVITKAHRSYRYLRPLLARLTSGFLKQYELEQVTRVGLRYLNQYGLGGSPTQAFAEYFVPDYSTALFSSHEIRQYVLQAHLDFEDEEMVVRSLVAAVPNREPLEFFYALDMDAFINAQTSSEAIFDRLDALHDHIYREFRRRITPAFVERLRSGPGVKT